MDPEEIAKRVSSLKICSSKSGESLIISLELASQGQQWLDSCLVGKVFSSKAVNGGNF